MEAGRDLYNTLLQAPNTPQEDPNTAKLFQLTYNYVSTLLHVLVTPLVLPEYLPLHILAIFSI